MVRKFDRELKLEAIRMASLAQLPGRVPQPLRVHRDLLHPRKESLHPVLRIIRPIRAAHIHNRRFRVSVFPREHQDTQSIVAAFETGVCAIIALSRTSNTLSTPNASIISIRKITFIPPSIRRRSTGC